MLKRKLFRKSKTKKARLSCSNVFVFCFFIFTDKRTKGELKKRDKHRVNQTVINTSGDSGRLSETLHSHLRGIREPWTRAVIPAAFWSFSGHLLPKKNSSLFFFFFYQEGFKRVSPGQLTTLNLQQRGEERPVIFVLSHTPLLKTGS